MGGKVGSLRPKEDPVRMNQSQSKLKYKLSEDKPKLLSKPSLNNQKNKLDSSRHTPKSSPRDLVSKVDLHAKSPNGQRKSAFNPNRVKEKKAKVVSKLPVDDRKDDWEYNVLEVIAMNNFENQDQDMIGSCLEKHFFMRCLEKQARMEIIREMTLCQVKEGTVIFKQGAIGNFFYIVKEGELSLKINKEEVRTLTRGDNFGELALLHSAPRSGTVTAVTTTLVWCMERRNFRKIVDHINNKNYEENKTFISKVSAFANLDPDHKSMLASNLIKVYYDKNDIIVKQGEVSNCLYIIKEGEVECISKNKSIRTLKKGDHFGEKSILLETTRTMDVIAKTDCVIYSISVDTLKSMVGERYIDVLVFNFIQNAFEMSRSFNRINPRLLENVFHLFSLKNYEKDEVVIQAGHVMGSMINIIVEGNLINKKNNNIEARRGDILFEDSLGSYESMNSRQKLAYNLVADPDCLIISIDTEVFVRSLGSSFKDIFKRSLALNSLNKIPLFKHLSHSKLEFLSNIIKIERYENGKKIITQGETGDKFYIIKSGKIEIFVDGKYTRSANENEAFGARALFFKEKRSATVQANGRVEVYVINAKDFQSILEENMLNYLKNKIYLEDESIALKDLDFIKDLGSGSFGYVSLVKSRKNKMFYAIKAMSKAQIDYDKLHSNIDQERGILLKIDHPFITKLVKSLKSDTHIFFLMEYIKGKELWDVIRDIGLLDKTQTQFYTASMLLAIDYLHERKLVHRDIKPENVMVTENVTLLI